MFEYLMPLLVMPDFEETLLHSTYQGVVREQIEYGKRYQVPWGVSESGYNRPDPQFNYQYQAFGVPGLGLKRGLVKRSGNCSVCKCTGSHGRSSESL